MQKFFLHLAVACITFTVSTHFTKVWKRFQNPQFRPQQYESVPPTSRRSSMPADPDLVDIYNKYAHAQTAHDRAFFERVEADEFKLFTGGRAYSRSEDIALMNAARADDVYKIEDLKFDHGGSVAVVTGRMTATDNRGHVDSWRWLDICLKTDHGWQIMSTTQLY